MSLNVQAAKTVISLLSALFESTDTTDALFQNILKASSTSWQSDRAKKASLVVREVFLYPSGQEKLLSSCTNYKFGRS